MAKPNNYLFGFLFSGGKNINKNWKGVRNMDNNNPGTQQGNQTQKDQTGNEREKDSDSE